MLIIKSNINPCLQNLCTDWAATVWREDHQRPHLGLVYEARVLTSARGGQDQHICFSVSGYDLKSNQHIDMFYFSHLWIRFIILLGQDQLLPRYSSPQQQEWFVHGELRNTSIYNGKRMKYLSELREDAQGTRKRGMEFHRGNFPSSWRRTSFEGADGEGGGHLLDSQTSKPSLWGRNWSDRQLQENSSHKEASLRSKIPDGSPAYSWS